MFYVAIATEKLSFICIYSLHSKMQMCANTLNNLIKILHIILLHNVINIPQSPMYIMFLIYINLIITTINKFILTKIYQ